MSQGPHSGSASRESGVRAPLNLAVIADLADGRVHGDPSMEVQGVRPLDRAESDELGLVADPDYVPAVPSSRAGALLVSSALPHCDCCLNCQR